MTDPVKQREMEVKVTQSQQKISEWQEELKHLKGFTHFPIVHVYSVHVLRMKLCGIENEVFEKTV